MLKVQKKPILFASLAIGLSILGYFWLLNQQFAPQLIWFSAAHLYLLITLLILIKIIGLVWPPLPGGIATIAAIPFVGWELAYLTDLTGTIIGATLCYIIAKKWGYRVLTYMFDTTTIEKITTTKVKKHRQTEFSFVMTILSRLVMTEASYYAAGILNISFWKFMLGALGSHLLLTLPSYYFAESVLKTRNPYLVLAGVIVVVPLFFVVKKRYFEEHDV